jgi:hypothetical protein
MKDASQRVKQEQQKKINSTVNLLDESKTVKDMAAKKVKESPNKMVYQKKSDAKPQETEETEAQAVTFTGGKAKREKKPKEAAPATQNGSSNRPATAKPNLNVSTAKISTPIKQRGEAADIVEPLSAARIFQKHNIKPISVTKPQEEGTGRNFELEERIRNLEASLLDASSKMNDNYAQLRST